MSKKREYKYESIWIDKACKTKSTTYSSNTWSHQMSATLRLEYFYSPLNKSPGTPTPCGCQVFKIQSGGEANYSGISPIYGQNPVAENYFLSQYTALHCTACY